MDGFQEGPGTMTGAEGAPASRNLGNPSAVNRLLRATKGSPLFMGSRVSLLVELLLPLPTKSQSNTLKSFYKMLITVLKCHLNEMVLPVYRGVVAPERGKTLGLFTTIQPVRTLY